MAVCCQNLPLGALSSRGAPSMLVGELFKKFSLFLNTGLCQLTYIHPILSSRAPAFVDIVMIKTMILFLGAFTKLRKAAY
jgi:hypothetical protein